MSNQPSEPNDHGNTYSENINAPTNEELIADLINKYSLENLFLFKLPGTPSLRWAYRGSYEFSTKGQIKYFEKMTLLAPEEKNRIRDVMVQAIARRNAVKALLPKGDYGVGSEIDSQAHELSNIFLLLTMLGSLIWVNAKWPIISLLPAIIAPILMLIVFSFLYTTPKSRKGKIITTLIMIFVCLITVIAFTEAPLKIIGPQILVFFVQASIDFLLFALPFAYWLFALYIDIYLRNKGYGLLLFSTISIYILTELPNYNIAPLLQDILKASLWAYVSIWIFYLLINSFLRLVLSLIYKIHRDRYPEDEILANVLDLIFYLEYIELNRFGDDIWKSSTIEIIDNIIHMFREKLSKKLSRDREIQPKLQQVMEEIANWFEEWKIEILVPNEKTFDNSREGLKRKLLLAAEGKWGGFDRAKAETFRPKIMRFIEGVRRAIGISLPLLVLLGLEYLPIQVSDATRNAIFSAAIGLVIVNLLSWIDPQYEKKMSNIKTLQGFLPEKQ